MSDARRKMTDLRILDLKSAEDALKELANLHAEAKALEAEYEEAVHSLKSAFEEETAGIERAYAHYESKLDSFILANRHMFKKPRSVKTLFGEFGLRLGTKVSIGDADQALADCKAQGLGQCIKVQESLIKSEVKKVLASDTGIQIAGTTVLKGDVSFHKIDKTFADKAIAQIRATRAEKPESAHAH